jgi:hypothetical protein
VPSLKVCRESTLVRSHGKGSSSIAMGIGRMRSSCLPLALRRPAVCVSGTAADPRHIAGRQMHCSRGSSVPRRMNGWIARR